MGLGNKSLWETANGFSHQVINTEHTAWIYDVHECVSHNNSASFQLDVFRCAWKTKS